MFRFHSTATLIAILCTASTAFAATVPFTESFSAGAADWRDAGGVVSPWTAAGGSDGGGYVSNALNFQSWLANDTPVIHRGEQGFNSSGGAFFGNWPAAGVTHFNVDVRHNAPVPLNFFARYATATPGFGAVSVKFTPVFPNTWTTISFAIDPSNPEFISFEAGNFNSVFVLRDITRVQVGVSVPAALAQQNVAFNFDIDRPSIVPEPGSLGMLVLGTLLAARRR